MSKARLRSVQIQKCLAILSLILDVGSALQVILVCNDYMYVSFVFSPWKSVEAMEFARGLFGLKKVYVKFVFHPARTTIFRFCFCVCATYRGVAFSENLRKFQNSKFWSKFMEVCVTFIILSLLTGEGACHVYGDAR